MVVPGLALLLMGFLYGRFTKDTPDGNYGELQPRTATSASRSVNGAFLEGAKDPRVWALFVIYGACFGIELTVNNVAALYFVDYFEYFQSMDNVQAVGMAGLIASLFGLMNLFARTLGGYFGDRAGARWGLGGRVKWLFVTVFCEGLALMLFSQMGTLLLAIPTLILFSLFVQMSEGATYSVVPFINKRALGSVAGIVGAGGNAGAVAAGFLFKMESLSWPTALFILGSAVTVASFFAFAVRFSAEAETEARFVPEPEGIAAELAGQPA